MPRRLIAPRMVRISSSLGVLSCTALRAALSHSAGSSGSRRRFHPGKSIAPAGSTGAARGRLRASAGSPRVSLGGVERLFFSRSQAPEPPPHLRVADRNAGRRSSSSRNSRRISPASPSARLHMRSIHTASGGHAALRRTFHRTASRCAADIFPRPGTLTRPLRQLAQRPLLPPHELYNFLRRSSLVSTTILQTARKLTTGKNQTIYHKNFALGATNQTCSGSRPLQPWSVSRTDPPCFARRILRLIASLRSSYRHGSIPPPRGIPQRYSA